MKFVLTFMDNSKRTVDIPDMALINLCYQKAADEDQAALEAARKIPKSIEKAP